MVEVVEASEAEQENGSSEVLVKLIDTAPCSSSLPDEDSPALEEDKEEEKVPVASVEETEQTEDRDDEPSVTTGSHTKSAASGRPTTSISRKELKGATMSGGTTCVCFVYHERTKLARFAVVGDSRAAVIPPVSSQLNKDLQEKEPKLSATKEELFHSFVSIYCVQDACSVMIWCFMPHRGAKKARYKKMEMQTRTTFFIRYRSSLALLIDCLTRKHLCV